MDDKLIAATFYIPNNELMTVRNLRKIEYIRQMEILNIRLLTDEKFMEAYHENYTDSYDSKSKALREAGDKLYHSERNLMGAVALYTSAILMHGKDSREIMLAYANRAAALTEFGYHAQGYDDCVLALESECSNEIYIDLLLRQGQCAANLKDLSLLPPILKLLESKELDAEQMAVLKQIKQTYQHNLHADNTKTFKLIDISQLQELNDTTKIIDNDDMEMEPYRTIATRDIQKGEEAFSEEIYAFAPLPYKLICSNCATTQMIPTRCKMCLLTDVVYCSIKCREAHAKIHKYECLAINKKLLVHGTKGFSEQLLALRFLITGIAETYPYLREKHNANEIWRELVDKDSQLGRNKNINFPQYFQVPFTGYSLQETIIDTTVKAQMIITFLKICTPFFDQMKDSNASMDEWDLVLSAIFFRLITLSYESYEQCLCIGNLSHPMCYLLQTNIWRRAYCVKIGMLHHLCGVAPFMITIHKNMQFMRYGCSKSIDSELLNNLTRKRFAVKFIKSGSELLKLSTLTLCDTVLFKYREKFYKQFLQRECECEECSSSNPNKTYHSNWTFRCESPDCGKVFVWESVNWNLITGSMRPKSKQNDPIDYIKCTHCYADQKYQWLETIHSLEKKIKEPNFVANAFRVIENSNKYFLKYNVYKSVMTSNFLMYGRNFEIILKHIHPDDNERLVNIINSFIKYCPYHMSLKSLRVAFLWDLMAMGKYKCTQSEMEEMIEGLSNVPERHRRIFLTYYLDYLQKFFIN